MPKVFFSHTAMSGIPENPMVDTKIMNLFQLRKKMALVFYLALGNGGHFGFSQLFLNGENSTPPWISFLHNIEQ